MKQDDGDRKLPFPQFDVVSDFSDHHFMNSGYSSISKLGKSCFKAMSKEWRILRESLPESIFVRVSETRFDLLRAAIIGAAGTPYHDALFFFDIVVPASYPREPPKVHYFSHGYRINPNLYSDGLVCLSLLNTWMGRRNEQWNAKQSTLLQVLLSLQSLVLNEKPYYNEPGRRLYGNEKASEYYNQEVFFLTCKTTLNLIRYPPRNFEALIRHHFRERANTILSACDAYANGRVAVGFYGSKGSGPSKFEVKRQFQVNMERVYPQLFAEFRRLEACVPPAGDRLVVEQKSPLAIANKKPKKGYFKKMIGKIKDILGFTNKNGKKASSKV
ncbi:putative ubiquitin-conjugating enzyme E2 38 [Prosopis cineraria]|uniref:putative ubiquitin-conjugating enzyme E2 38 n=1 Tax=Prosopis cineraria TaxID=364024 RepID=UPI00240FE114|nr:putative ubiquitin-conjugating enzyme E2 38 [Prosopis cineraria]